MNKILLVILVISITTNAFGQLPECVKEKCDSILKVELGESIYASCVTYLGYECSDKLDTIMDNPCEAESRHSYRVKYKFNFPNEDRASFNLGFYCAGYYGKMHVQSEYFYRTNQSDLPKGFKDKGLKIVDYEKIHKIAHKKDVQLNGSGVLALDQDKIYWVFSGRKPYRSPDGIGDEAMVVHMVSVDPYTGKVIASSIRRE